MPVIETTEGRLEIPDTVPQDRWEGIARDFLRHQRVNRAQNSPVFGSRGDLFGDKGTLYGDSSSASSYPSAERNENTPSPLMNSLQQMRADIFAVDDEAYADIVSKSLGDALVSIDKDDNGYSVITYRTRDGGLASEYVNAPGLDRQDIRRAGAQSVPYMASGGAIGAAAKNLGVAGRTLSQMAGAGATSAGSDIVAGQAPDPGRAGAAAVGAGAGELLGTAAQKIMRGRQAARMVDDAGNFTNEGSVAARQAQLPDDLDLSPEMRRQFASDFVDADDPLAVGRKTFVESQGSRGTVGQYTRDPQQVMLEQELARGEFGQPAKRIMETAGPDMSALRRNLGVGDDVVGPSQVGAQVRGAVRDKFKGEQAAVDDAFSNLRNMDLTPGAGQRASLGQFFRQSDEGFANTMRSVTKETHPNTIKALQLLNNVTRGRAKTSKIPFVNQQSQPVDFVDIRKRLSILRDQAYRNTANVKNDGRAISQIIDKYDDWLRTTAANSDEETAKALLKAWDLSAKVKAKYGTTGLVKNDPGGKWIKDILEGDLTAEQIAKKITSSSRGTRGGIRKLKNILGENSPEWSMLKMYVISDVTDDVFRDVNRSTSMARKKLGELLRGKEAPLGLFNKTDVQYLENMNKVLDLMDVSNVPKTRSEYLQLSKNIQDDWFRYILRRKGTHETFQGRTVHGSAWHILARVLPRIPGIDSGSKYSARKLAEKAVSGKLPSKGISNAPAATIGAATGRTVNEENF